MLKIPVHKRTLHSAVETVPSSNIRHTGVSEKKFLKRTIQYREQIMFRINFRRELIYKTTLLHYWLDLH